jgi:hypothetical protein
MIGFESRQGLGIYLFTAASRTALRPTQPPIQRIPGGLSLEVKRLGREADHSPPSNAEVNNAWSYTSTPQYAFMAWCLFKTRKTLPLPLPLPYPTIVHVPHYMCTRGKFLSRSPVPVLPLYKCLSLNEGPAERTFDCSK